MKSKSPSPEPAQDKQPVPFSFQKHKSQIDLKWQVKQFKKYERSSPYDCQLASVPASEKLDEDVNISDMKELQKLHMDNYHKLSQQL